MCVHASGVCRYSVSCLLLRTVGMSEKSPRREETTRERAERIIAERNAKVEAERDELSRHLAQVDARLHKQRMETEATEQKRRTRVFQEAQKEPPRRKMYDDKELANKALVPGPGTYTPKLSHQVYKGYAGGTGGKTFGAGNNYKPTTKYNKFQGSSDYYMEKLAASQPSAASYSPRMESSGLGQGRTSHPSGTSFGLPPHLMETYRHAEVPSAHDMERMVNHLRDNPGPGQHSPRDPQRNLAFRMVDPGSGRAFAHAQAASARGTSSAASDSAVSAAPPLDKGTPGPGTYEQPLGVTSTQATGRATSLYGQCAAMNQLERAMALSKTVPGPGRYESASTMRAKGAPRFSPGKEFDFITMVMNDARQKPGPGAHGLTPTFADELEHERYLKAAVDEQRVRGTLSAR